MPPLDVATVPLDAMRRSIMRMALRSDLLTRILTRRDSRIAFTGSVQITLIFALALRVPVALYFLGPVVFGVPHLAADVRYLALRRSPPRALLAVSVAFALAITAAQVAAGLGVLSGRTDSVIDVTLGALWIGWALCLALREKPLLAVLVALVSFGLVSPLAARAYFVSVALVHFHNVVAIVAWVALFRRRRGWAVLPLGLVIVFTAALLSGVYLSWTSAHGGFLSFGMHANRLGAWLAPGLPPETAIAVTTTFVFLQGVHYAAWTGWIPQDDLRGEGTLTFRMTARGLVRDFGPIPFGCIAVAALGMVCVATWNIRASVGWYLTLAKSHAWFELALLAFFLVRRANSYRTETRHAVKRSTFSGARPSRTPHASSRSEDAPHGDRRRFLG
jgi:hypothetical protein